MHSELTNLLPEKRAKVLRQEYFVRLLTVTLFTATAVFLGSGALLVPSYLYLNQEISNQKALVASLDAILATSHGKEVNNRFAALAKDAKYLSRLATTTSAVVSVEAILGVPHSGIQISAITLTPPVRGNDGKMVLTGIASTRETLRTYVTTLSRLPYVSNAEVPISVYAKESLIPFTLTLTGSLTP